MKKILLFTLSISIASILVAQSTFAEFGDSGQIWLDTRVKNVQKGIKEQVEMPFVVISTGWGCTCPDYYMSTEALVGTGLYLSPITPKGFPVSDSLGYSLIVKGYFTGKNKKFIGDDSIIWLVPQFKITSWENNEAGDNADAPTVIK